ncbi:MAG: phosphatidylglycerophosphatase A [Marinovum sp.]|nr:phosphatidylglycerophosphatase A [Marinovum sp.]
MTTLVTAFVTVLGVGYLRPASGTWGSLAAFPLGYAVWLGTGALGFGVVTLIVTILGVRATAQYIETRNSKDPSEVVIDEVAGQWIALLPVAVGASARGLEPWDMYPGLIVGFLLFRLFDIWKPGPVGWMDRRGDAFGVMFDDVIAGIFAALGVVALAAIAHGVLTG